MLIVKATWKILDARADSHLLNEDNRAIVDGFNYSEIRCDEARPFHGIVAQKGN